MELITIQCENCGATRVGRMKMNRVTATRDDCHECGSTEWRLHPNLEYLNGGE